MTPEIILGPPGTGKTHTLLSIMEGCIASGIPPEEIGLVSFTRRAAEEAISRACRKFSLEREAFPWFRTLHSACFRLLGLSPADVLQGRLLREFSDWVGVELTWGKRLEEGTTFSFKEGDRILHMENLSRVRCMGLQQQYDEDNDNLDWSEVRRVAKGLHEYKRQKHLVDYSDMLSLYAAGSMHPRLRVLLVDEAQDLSDLQWQVVGKLSQGCQRVVVAGDDDQCIFRWAGASLEKFVGLPGRERVLGVSHRVPRSVQRLALDCVGRVQTRRPKSWAPRDSEGVVDLVGDLGWVDLEGDDILVLARNTYVLLEQVVPVLRAEGIVYEWHGQSSIDPDLLSAIGAWERMRRGDGVGVGEALGALRWTSERERMQSLRSQPEDSTCTGWEGMAIWHEAMVSLPKGDMSYILAARRRGESTVKRPRVRLSTIHGAKGAQAKHVVLHLEQAPRTAEEAEARPEDEARVWYVGLTRSSERLTLVQPQGKHGWQI
jgi:hypothetical protein